MVSDNTKVYPSKRPLVAERLFTSDAVEAKIREVQKLLSGNPRLAWMFANCFPNTLESTVHYRVVDGEDDTFVYTGDIPAMWLRDSGAQVWPYVQLCAKDKKLRKMLRGVILRQLKCINIDRYANAFNDGPTGAGWQKDVTRMTKDVFERKYEIDSLCYPVRFFRMTDRTYDTVGWNGYGAPVKPVGLIASVFRPSDDRTSLPFLVPSNFMAVSSLKKMAEILSKVNAKSEKAAECQALASEVETALKQYAVVDHPKYGKIYAYEVDGFGNHLLMDDANVPSLLGMGYLGDVPMDDPVYQNTRRFVWSEDNPWFFRGKAGEGIGGPHIGYDMVWPMSIMMKCFTATDDHEIRWCMRTLLATDAGTGFIHESFNKDNANDYTRPWFAWQNTLFGELVLKLIADGKTELLNNL